MESYSADMRQASMFWIVHLTCLLDRLHPIDLVTTLLCLQASIRSKLVRSTQTHCIADLNFLLSQNSKWI